MDSSKIRSGRRFLAGLALAILTPAILKVIPAAAQDSPPAATQADAKRSGLTVVVKTDDHKDLPANSKVQITFRDKTCGDLFGGPDKDATIVNGKARFEDLPVCLISIKVDIKGYMNPRKVLKPADFKAEIEITLESELR